MKRKLKKKETFLTKFMNTFITVTLAGIMIYGLQCYSACDLKFVQLSDVHFSDSGENTTFKMTGDSPKLLQDAVNQINEISDLDFVMLTGDQINVPYEKELQAFLKYAEQIKAPWYIAFGNHDRCVGGYLTKQLYLDIVNNHNDNFKYKTPYYSFIPRKGYKVIVLDTIIDERVTSNGEISNEQLAWLDNQMKESQKDVVLIFMHVPIVEPFPSNGHRLLNAAQVQHVIEKYKNPIAVFSGHYHGAKITQNGNILYVSSPALVSYPNAFRIITVRSQRKKVVFDIQLRETREKNTQKLAKLLVFGANVYTGEEKDRNGVYEINKN